VVWADHYVCHGEFSIEECKEFSQKPYYGEFSGYLVSKSKQCVTIASNIWEDGTVSDPFTIMRRAIVELEVENV